MWQEALSIRMTTELPTVTCRDESEPFEHPRGVSIYMYASTCHMQAKNTNSYAHVLFSLFLSKTALWRFHATRPWPGSLDFRWGVWVWGLSFETAKLFSVWT